MKRLLPLIILYLLVATAASLAWLAYDGREHDAVLTLAFLDVGQGDAIFIESTTGVQILIDGGIDHSVLSALARVMPFYDRSIDVIIGTHPDKDHIGGLVDVFERYTVSHIIDSGFEAESDIYELYVGGVQSEGASVRGARRGDVIDIGGGAYIRILFPDDGLGVLSDNNAASIVAQLVYGETEAMLTGDAPSATERHLVSLDVSLDVSLESDILKTGHHGSKTSTSQEFLAAVAPAYAIVSAGKDNSYGHPHVDVVERLTAASTTILTTFDEGTIIFESDGKELVRVR